MLNWVSLAISALAVVMGGFSLVEYGLDDREGRIGLVVIVAIAVNMYYVHKLKSSGKAGA